MSVADEKVPDLLLRESNRGAAMMEVFCGRTTESIASQFAAHGFSKASAGAGQCFEDFLSIGLAARCELDPKANRI